MNSLAANIEMAKRYLAQFEAGVLNRIAGEDVPALDGATFEILSPVDLKPLARVAHGGAADIDRAAKAAKEAFPAWAAMAGDARKKLLHKVADAIEAGAEEIASSNGWTGAIPQDHGEGGAARRGELPLLCGPRARSCGWQLDAGPDTSTSPLREPIGPFGVITPVEHAVQ